MVKSKNKIKDEGTQTRTKLNNMIMILLVSSVVVVVLY